MSRAPPGSASHCAPASSPAPVPKYAGAAGLRPGAASQSGSQAFRPTPPSMCTWVVRVSVPAPGRYCTTFTSPGSSSWQPAKNSMICFLDLATPGVRADRYRSLTPEATSWSMFSDVIAEITR